MFRFFVGNEEIVGRKINDWLAREDVVVLNWNYNSEQVNGQTVFVVVLEYRDSDRVLAKKIMEERL